MKKKQSTKYDKLTLLKKSQTYVSDTPESSLLETFTNEYADRDYWIHFECPEFTSLCPITGQPDMGKILIEYVPNKECIESKSLKFYLFAFRNFGTFQEEIVNKILDDVVQASDPRRAKVSGFFAARGGISISVKAEYP